MRQPRMSIQLALHVLFVEDSLDGDLHLKFQPVSPVTLYRAGGQRNDAFRSSNQHQLPPEVD